MNVIQFVLKGFWLWLLKPMVLKTLKRRLGDMRAMKSKKSFMMIKNKIKTQALLTLSQALTFWIAKFLY